MDTDLTQPGSGRSPGSAGTAAAQSQSLHRHYPRRRATPTLDSALLAEGLGWFSVLSGIAALLAPRTVGSATGLRSQGRRVVRSIGLRELATGIGILTQSNPAPWLWARTAGDVVDLALLASSVRAGGPGSNRAALSFVTMAGVLALDALAAAHLTKHAGHPLVSGVAAPTDLYFETSVATARSPQECYRFWRNIENLPRFLGSLESVRRIDERRFRWVAKEHMAVALGAALEWDCEITEDHPDAALAWRTLNGAPIPNAGSVIFEPAPGSRGTIVRLSIHYSPVGGELTSGLARLLRQDPQSQVREDLRRFKQLLETGEVATTRGQPTGRRTFIGRAARRWGLTSSN